MKSTGKPFWTGIIIGVVLALGPVFGFLGTAFGMFRAYGTLGDSGISDQQALSHGVSLALYSTAIGLVLCPIGVTILIVSLVLRTRAHRANPPPLPAP